MCVPPCGVDDGVDDGIDDGVDESVDHGVYLGVDDGVNDVVDDGVKDGVKDGGVNFTCGSLDRLGGRGGTDKMFNLETGFKFCVTDEQTDRQAYGHYNMMTSKI